MHELSRWIEALVSYGIRKQLLRAPTQKNLLKNKYTDQSYR